MKKRNAIATLLVLFILGFTSCSDDSTPPPKEPTTEKLPLEIINKVEVIIHNGHLHGASFHANGQPNTNFRRKGHFILERQEKGDWKHIPSKNPKDKDYLNEGKPFVMEGPHVTNPKYSGQYSFEFRYYDKKGNRIDSEFFNNSKLYQTLFSVKEYTENKTKKVVPVTKTKDFFKYTFRDTNPVDKMLAPKVQGVTLAENYLGLKGYGRNTKSRIAYKLKVTFAKFKDDTSKKQSIYLEDATASAIAESVSFEIPIIIPVGRGAEDHSAVFGAYFNMSADDFENQDTFGDYNPEGAQYWM